MSVTIGCLTRVFVGEIPYLSYYFDHYISIGIDKFYLVFADMREFERIDSIIAPYKDRCKYIFETQGRNVNKALGVDVSEFETDYILSVDVDEFLYVAGDASLKDLISEANSPGFMMRWIMSPRDFDDPHGKITGFRGHAGKKIARTNLITGISGPHGFAYAENVTLGRDKRLQLVHYWGRSFNDIVIKCMYQMLPNSKRSSIAEMETLLESGKLPERLRVLASLVRHDQNVVLDVEQRSVANTELEQELLSVVSRDFLDNLEAVYRKFKADLVYETQVAVYPREGNIYDLGRILAYPDGP